MNETKPYIFPDHQFDDESVPTPWTDYINNKPEEEHDALFDAAIHKAAAWIENNAELLERDDIRYLFWLGRAMGNPLTRHEAMNYFIIMKQYIEDKE